MLASPALLVQIDDSARVTAVSSLRSLDALAGEYFFSNGFSGETLTINSDGRFTLLYHDCVSQCRGYGRAKMVHGRVVLRTYLVCRLLLAAPRELIPIHWGDRLYLIPQGKGESFCTYVNTTGGAPGWPPEPCFIRRDDDKKPVAGLPSVPKEWEPMLLTSPINGKIIEVMGHGKARVDFGYESGAWRGMPLWVTCEGSPCAWTVAVHATNCVVENNHPATVFRVGDPVSSRRGRNE
jgi:hypothetical protein